MPDRPTPTIFDETQPRAAARGVLQRILGDEDASIEDRLAAADALGALLDQIPASAVPAEVVLSPGTLADAEDLLSQAADLEETGRGIVAVSLARGHLRRAREDAEPLPDPAPQVGDR